MVDINLLFCELYNKYAMSFVVVLRLVYCHQVWRYTCQEVVMDCYRLIVYQIQLS